MYLNHYEQYCLFLLIEETVFSVVVQFSRSCSVTVDLKIWEIGVTELFYVDTAMEKKMESCMIYGVQLESETVGPAIGCVRGCVLRYTFNLFIDTSLGLLHSKKQLYSDSWYLFEFPI